MADEITVTSQIATRKGLLNFPGQSQRTRFDQTGNGAGSFTVDVGTSEETISFGDVAPGFVRLTNLNATNFVRVRFTTTDDAIRLRPNGGVAMFQLDAGASVIVIADTAACLIQVEAITL
jgi:hypothetical protein